MPLIAAYLPISPIYIHLVVLQMGGYFSSIIEWASFGKHAQILILGLDASGKTTIINRLKTCTHAVTVDFGKYAFPLMILGSLPLLFCITKTSCTSASPLG